MIFVAPDGQTANLGTKVSPLSFEAGIQRVSKILKAETTHTGGITLTLRGGHYSFFIETAHANHLIVHRPDPKQV